MLMAKLSENFLSPDRNGPNFGGFGDLGVRGLKRLWFYCKGHVLAWIHVVWAILHENWSPGWLRKKESHRDHIFHVFPRSPYWSNCHQISFMDRFPGHNQLCHILFQSVHGLWFCGVKNFGLFHRNEVLLLMQCYVTMCTPTSTRSHQDRCRLITLSKLFTLMVLRLTQPSIPSG